MKKTLLAVLGGICLTTSSFGQEEEKNTIVLKVYSNASRLITETPLGYNSTNQTYSTLRTYQSEVGYFTPAVTVYKPSGDFHEFEFSRLIINNTGNQTKIVNMIDGKTINTISGVNTTSSEIAFRYDFNMMVTGKKGETGLRTYLGFGVSPFYRNNRFSTSDPAFFPVSRVGIGGNMTVIPRLNYVLNDRWLFDLSLPYSFAQAGMTFTNLDDPALPSNERGSSTFDFNQFPNALLVRLGVGIKL